MHQFEGRTAFITGGAQGIGLGIARALAREGVRLALADIDADALTTARDELSATVPVETFVLDVRDRERFAEVADAAEDRLGPVSLLFNNAGVAGGASPTEMTYELWDWVLGVNLTGVVNGIQTFVPRIIERGDGYIVNTASGAGLVVIGSGMMYCASKFAVVGLSEALHNSMARRGIGVSVLCPAFVDTGIVEHSAAMRPGGAEHGTVGRVNADKRTHLAAGASIDEVGELVLAGMRAEQLYIYTDDAIRPHLERRHQMLKDALATAPPSARR